MLNVEQKGVITIIQGEIPTSETFDLSEVMRGATAGKAMWNTYFKSWQPVPQGMLLGVVQGIRKRKGLSPDPPNPSEFIDKE
jgi:elongation factor 2